MAMAATLTTTDAMALNPTTPHHVRHHMIQPLALNQIVVTVLLTQLTITL